MRYRWLCAALAAFFLLAGAAAADEPRARPAPLSKESVRLVIRTPQFVQLAQASLGRGRPPRLQPLPFVDGLVALPVFEMPYVTRMLEDDDNERFGLSLQGVHELGRANLRRDLQPLMQVAKIAGPGRIEQLTGDTFHPSRLLLHDSWAPLAAAQGGRLIVAAPTVDNVLYIGEDTPAAIDALRAAVKSTMERAPNRLSNLLLRWNPSGWDVIPP